MSTKISTVMATAGMTSLDQACTQVTFQMMSLLVSKLIKDVVLNSMSTTRSKEIKWQNAVLKREMSWNGQVSGMT